MYGIMAQAGMQGGWGSGWSLMQIIITIIVIAACIGIMFVALRQFGVQIPPFVVTIFWIVVAAFVAIFAIRLIMSM
jgi:hypothetical protein